MSTCIRWLFALFAVLCLLPWPARADTADDVHALLIAERFDDAERTALAALQAIHGTRTEDLQQRLAALDLVIEAAMAHSKLASVSTGESIDQAAALALALYGEDARQRARPLALAGLRELRVAKNDAEHAHALAAVKQAVELAEHGQGTISAQQASFVYDSASSVALIERRFADGLPFAERAEALVRDARSPWERQWHARLLGRLGLFQVLSGEGAAGLANARDGAQRAQRIGAANSLQYADAMSYLGQVQMYNGDYAGVRDSLQVAVDIYRQHPSLGVKIVDRALNSLANALRRLGDFEHARPLFEEVIAHNEIDAEGHFDEMLPESLNTLAGLENTLGNTQRARELYERALDLEEKLYGALHPLYLEKPLINLGDVAIQQGDLAAAERYFQRAAALDATEKSGLLTSYVTEGQATLALAQGRPAVAEALIADSIAQLRGRYGEQHPLLILRWCSLAVAQARQGKNDAAYAAAETSERLRIDLLRRIAPALSGSQALNFKGELRTCSGVFLSLAARADDPRRALRAWQLVAESRGLATRLLAARLAAARNSADAAGKARWSAWERAARIYADALLHNAADHAELNRARDALETAETALGKPTLVAAGLQSAPALDFLLAQPRAGAVVVAYTVAPHFALEPQARGTMRSGHDVYALVSSGASSRLVALGSAGAIDAAIDLWLRLLRDPGSDAQRLLRAGRSVREAVWDPLALGPNPARVFVVPDGALFRVNFAALPDGEHFFVERGWRVHLLDHESDLAIAAPAASRDQLLIVAAPDFGPNPAAAAHRGACANGLAALSGSADEAAGVAHLWRATFGTNPMLLLDRAASKPALAAAAKNASVLHFATHAFEVGSGCPQLYASRGVSLEGSDKPTAPLSQGAALALAGANRFFADGSAEGLLTSAEAATLPLGAARWVVLAACDTGLGEIIGDEGVFGLRRGFRLAGARTVLMSLWKIDDAATTQWMQALYAARWRGHVDTPDALAQAELAVLASRREHHQSVHPYFWAGFVASGDWR